MTKEGLQLEEAFKELRIEFITSYGNFISFNLGDETKAMMYYQHLLRKWRYCEAYKKL